jgi:hypothetical protein
MCSSQFWEGSVALEGLLNMLIIIEDILSNKVVEEGNEMKGNTNKMRAIDI